MCITSMFHVSAVQPPILFPAGAASHAVDYRRSAGGFIHGFRYNSRALHKHLEWKYNGVKWPSLTIDAVDLTDHIVKRVNEASVSHCISECV